MLLVRRRVQRFYKSWWLDGVIAVLTVGAAAGALIFAPLRRSLPGGSADVVAVTLAYPVADMVLVALLVGVFAATGWRPGRMWTVFGIGLILNSAADVIYTFQSSAGTYVEGTPLEALWVVASCCGRAVAVRPGHGKRMRLQGWRAIAAPLGFGALMHRAAQPRPRARHRPARRGSRAGRARPPS